MHISAQLIQSFIKEYGSWNCAKEKLLIPLEVHITRSVEQNFLSFREKKLKSCNFFYLLAHPAETAYLSFRDRELFNDVRLIQLRHHYIEERELRLKPNRKGGEKL